MAQVEPGPTDCQRQIAEFPIVDMDSHVTEPPDLWTARIRRPRWAGQVPHVVFDEKRQIERWVVGDKRLTGVAGWAVAGWHEYPPSHPPTLREADPAAWDAQRRSQRLDEYGITMQALYPNLLAFFPYAFLALEDAELRVECVRAYNDFVADFAAAAPGRFIPLTALPFWDVQASVAEIERCAALGHKGIIFAAKPYKLGFPRLIDDHWAPILHTAQDIGLSVNFHVGFQEMNESEIRSIIGAARQRSDYAKESTLTLLGNAEAIVDVIMSGLCEKYPDLAFVSVESGFGWLPYLIESMDWQWVNSGARHALPGRLMPSDYFRRQIYGSFWFERVTVAEMLHLYADNFMFESDFPHPTSLSPGPISTVETPRAFLERTLADTPLDICRKVMYQNAAKVYGLDLEKRAAGPATTDAAH